MSFIVEQKIKGRIYLYKVDSYWDKSKKQSRQKRTYLGPKDAKKKSVVKQVKTNIIHKNYGNIFLLKKLSQRIGLYQIIKECFPENYLDLLGLAYYQIIQSDPFYLFPYWQQEHYMPGVRKMDSPTISKFLDEIGHDQRQRKEFQGKWIAHLKPVNALFYDITSISSYSTNIDFIEWGYNRDNENLAQLNMGVAFCNNKSLPLYYTLFPGSIVDVKTLKNCITYLKSYGLKEFMLVLDRGFFSTANILEMDNKQDNIRFIQPLSFSLNNVKAQIKKHKKELKDINNNFSFNNDLLSHFKTGITFGGHSFSSHIFFNEKAELDQRQALMKKIIEFEEKIIKNKPFRNLKEALFFKEKNIIKSYQKYFKWNKTSKKLERNTRTIKAKIAKLGYFIIATNDDKLNKEEVLSNYRNKDQVEKVFNVLKNEINENRLRVHSQYNTDAKLFISFLALIIQAEIIRLMRKKKLFKTYTVKELLLQLKNIKRTQMDGQTIISEISKKQRLIFEVFDFNLDEIHRY